MAAEVATTLAPLTKMPAAVSRVAETKTSRTWSGGRWRSTGGVAIAGVMYTTPSRPAPARARGIVGIGAVECGEGAQGVAEGRLVVRRAAHPAIGQPGPAGD